MVEFCWYEHERTDVNGDFLYRLLSDTGIEPEDYPATALAPSCVGAKGKAVHCGLQMLSEGEALSTRPRNDP